MSLIKQSYKIPNSINVTKLDTPLSMRWGTFGSKKPRTIGLLMLILVCFLIWGFISLKMLRNEFGILATIGFTFGFIWLSRLSIKVKRTGEMGFKSFLPTIKFFLDYKSRTIITRGNADETEVDLLNYYIPIEDIEEEKGLMHYTNGDVGFLLDVIGHGSSALFDDEQEEIILAYENVLRDLDVGVSINIDFKQDSQKCFEQIEAIETKRHNNTNPTIDLIHVRRLEALKELESSFKTTHQTMYLRAPDEDTLNQCIQMLIQQKENGLFRVMETQYGEDLYNKLKAFYKLS